MTGDSVLIAPLGVAALLAFIARHTERRILEHHDAMIKLRVSQQTIDGAHSTLRRAPDRAGSPARA